MVMFKKILIATDGSSCSRKAAYYGIEIAKLSNSRILAVYVVDLKMIPEEDQCGSFSMPKAEARDLLRQRGEQATRYVENIARKEGVSTESRIVEGNPAEEIMKLANEEAVDLIVMGTIGATGIKKYLIGSVADKVVRHSKIPVMTVKK